MKTIHYHPNADAVSDAFAEQKAQEFLLNSEQDSIAVSTDNFVTAIRCLVAEGVYPAEDVVFFFEGKQITINKFGVATPWPAGFCDFTMKLSERIISARFRNKKNEKE